mmetsp:Transcript_182/g.336  ORF Transcript_182/g.336 Transcript_182/m.336 type:complete len:380 (-) Transcript_182:1618-2757(-)
MKSNYSQIDLDLSSKSRSLGTQNFNSPQRKPKNNSQLLLKKLHNEILHRQISAEKQKQEVDQKRNHSLQQQEEKRKRRTLRSKVTKILSCVPKSCNSMNRREQYMHSVRKRENLLKLNDIRVKKGLSPLEKYELESDKEVDDQGKLHKVNKTPSGKVTPWTLLSDQLDPFELAKVREDPIYYIQSKHLRDKMNLHFQKDWENLLDGKAKSKASQNASLNLFPKKSNSTEGKFKGQVLSAKTIPKRNNNFKERSAQNFKKLEMKKKSEREQAIKKIRDKHKNAEERKAVQRSFVNQLNERKKLEYETKRSVAEANRGKKQKLQETLNYYNGMWKHYELQKESNKKHKFSFQDTPNYSTASGNSPPFKKKRHVHEHFYDFK